MQLGQNPLLATRNQRVISPLVKTKEERLNALQQPTFTTSPAFDTASTGQTNGTNGLISNAQNQTSTFGTGYNSISHSNGVFAKPNGVGNGINYYSTSSNPFATSAPVSNTPAPNPLVHGSLQKKIEWNEICNRLRITEKKNAKGCEFPYTMNYSCCGSTSRYHYGGTANSRANDCPVFGLMRKIELTDNDLAFLLQFDKSQRSQMAYNSDWQNEMTGTTKVQASANRRSPQVVKQEIQGDYKMESLQQWSIPQTKEYKLVNTLGSLQQKSVSKNNGSKPTSIQELSREELLELLVSSSSKKESQLKELNELRALKQEIEEAKQQSRTTSLTRKKTRSIRQQSVERGRAANTKEEKHEIITFSDDDQITPTYSIGPSDQKPTKSIFG